MTNDGQAALSLSSLTVGSVNAGRKLSRRSQMSCLRSGIGTSAPIGHAASWRNVTRWGVTERAKSASTNDAAVWDTTRVWFCILRHTYVEMLK